MNTDLGVAIREALRSAYARCLDNAERAGVERAAIELRAVLPSLPYTTHTDLRRNFHVS